MATASDERLDRHWKSFAALKEDYRRKRIVLGVDRSFARKWLLFGGRGNPMLGRLTAIVLVVFTVVSLGGAIFLGYYGAYTIALLLLVLAFLSWRLLLQIAIAYARTAATGDEQLFRTWFKERRLSILIKASSEIVWNDVAD